VKEYRDQEITVLICPLLKLGQIKLTINFGWKNINNILKKLSKEIVLNLHQAHIVP
jgi:hypothetical protein